MVFSDVAGSTALGERLDPESLRRLMSRYFEEMETVLVRHGGTVEKFIGDAVMAVFGHPVMHEDDALRAVRAAVEMEEALATLNEQLEREQGVTIAVRIGVNTGEVVVGDGGQGQSFATGDAVNTAARLEQAASAGEILIGEQTFGLVRDAVAAERAPPVEAKGKALPVTAYRLLAVHPAERGRRRRLDAPMVGRERHLAQLRQAFGNAVADDSCQLFTVLGGAGVGKSRLVGEFLASLGEEAQVLAGRCLSYGEGITFWPLAEALKEAASLGDSEPAEQARARLAALVEDDDEAQLIASRVAELIGLAPGQATSEEGFWAVRKLLETLARRRPVVFVVDDLNWAEPTFLDLVEHLADWSRDAPILILCMARPELLDVRLGWSGGKLNAASVLLEPLSDGDCEALIANLLGKATLPATLEARVLEAAEGVPLFVEELLAMLIDDGSLERRNGAWEATRDLETVPVPPTIQALLAARLDRLAAEERIVLECAAVEGKLFHLGAVTTLAPETIRPEVSERLQSLVRKELVRPAGASFAGEVAFRFRHLLFRDAAYDAMPKERRAELHERYADWLEQQAGERAAEYEELLGYHLEQAHRYLAELGPLDRRGRELGDRAATRLLASGYRAITAREDVPAAANLLERACALLPADSPERLSALPELAAALISIGELARADPIVEEAIETARGAGDERVEARALLVRVSLQAQTDPAHDFGRSEVKRLIGVLERVGDNVGLARAWIEIGKARIWTGRGEAATDALTRAVDFAERAGARAERRDALTWLIWAILVGPLPAADGIVRFEEMRRHPEWGAEVTSTALACGAQLKAMQGRFDEARSEIAASRARHLELGLALSWAGNSMLSGMIELLAGDPAAAERELREGYEALDRLGETGFLSNVVTLLAEVVRVQGRHEEALKLAEAGERVSAPDDVEANVGWRNVRARVLAHEGNSAEAERLARESIALLEPTDLLFLQAISFRVLGDVLLLAGRRSDAVSALEEALRLAELKGDVVSAGQTRAQLDELAIAGP